MKSLSEKIEKMSDKTKSVYLTLLELSKQRHGEEIYITYSGIAKKANIEVNHVSFCLKMLINDKIIKKNTHYNKTGGCACNSYIVL